MESKEVVFIANKILRERIDSLLKDVRHCLFYETPDAPAPFPAILYCFSVIDLLGSFVSGRFDEKSDTQNAKEYMQKFMYYSDLQINLLQKIFRHKLVHSGQPKPIYKSDEGKLYFWRYIHNSRQDHLSIDMIDAVKKQYRFTLSIYSFAEDIKDSVFAPEGYLHKLKTTPDLQGKFKKVYKKIYEE
jgi:hypothetical protein